jgi:catechol 2,3-dioxygenase-like lactoylglutathione lyase family enzyme
MPISHIGHAELLVGDLAASAEFFTRLIGLQVTEEAAGRVYLRAWQDWDHHTLIFAPDWDPIRWETEVGQLGNSMWGTPLPESFRLGTSLGDLTVVAGAAAG